jgi:hypothetical protein
MLTFISLLVESQPARKEKEKEREKRKSSKKKKIEKDKTEKRAVATDVYSNSEHIFDNNALFEVIMKRKELRTLFG